MTTPNPGSKEAIEAGCTCSTLDNGRGRGYMGQAGIYVFTAGCPIHPLPEWLVVKPAPESIEHEEEGK